MKHVINIFLETGVFSYFANQLLPQIELFHNGQNYGQKVYTLSKILDKEVARLHLNHAGADIEILPMDQSEYIGIPIIGPFKSDKYRY